MNGVESTRRALCLADRLAVEAAYQIAGAERGPEPAGAQFPDHEHLVGLVGCRLWQVICAYAIRVALASIDRSTGRSDPAREVRELVQRATLLHRTIHVQPSS